MQRCIIAVWRWWYSGLFARTGRCHLPGGNGRTSPPAPSGLFAFHKPNFFNPTNSNFFSRQIMTLSGKQTAHGLSIQRQSLRCGAMPVPPLACQCQCVRSPARQALSAGVLYRALPHCCCFQSFLRAPWSGRCPVPPLARDAENQSRPRFKPMRANPCAHKLKKS